VYQGEKGSLYGVYRNNSDVDLKNLAVQILVDDRVARQSVKPLLKKNASSSFKVSNWWFNELGRHKLSLVVDPDNSIKELDEKNNRISHTINVVPRPGQQRTSGYDKTGAAALTGLLGTLGRDKAASGSSPAPSVVSTPPVYTQPVTPTVTTTTSDYGTGSSSSSGSSGAGTTTKKKPPKKKPTPTLTAAAMDL
jgi:subtilase family serine protease